MSPCRARWTVAGSVGSVVLSLSRPDEEKGRGHDQERA